MISEKQVHILKIYNRSIGIYVVATFVIQLLMVLLEINFPAIIYVFMAITVSALFINFILLIALLFFVLFKKQNTLGNPIAWSFINQIGLFFSLFVIFSTIMTIVNF